MSTKKNIDTPLSAVIVLFIYITLWILVGIELIFAMDEGWYSIPIRKHYFIYKLIGLILFIPFCALLDILIIRNFRNFIKNAKTNIAVNKVIRRQKINNGLKNLSNM